MPTQSPTPPTLPKKRRPLIIRLLRGLTVLVLSLAVLIPCLYVVEKHRGRAAWRAYETEAKARGVKLDLSDFIPPQIPDAENFASIPIFEAAFRAADVQQEIPNPFKLPTRPGRMLPKLAHAAQQEPIDLVAWQEYFVETKLLPAAGENVAADVLKALETFAAPLAQLQKAAARPHCRFPVHWEKPGAEFPCGTILQSAATLLTLKVAAHLSLGESAVAYEDFRDGLQLVTAIRGEPTFLPALVRTALGWRMEMALWDGLAKHQWKEPELRKIEGDLAKLNGLEDYQFGLSGTRAELNQMLDMIIERSPLLDDVIGRGRAEWRSHLQQLPTGWLYQNKLRINRYCDELAAGIDPVAHRSFLARDLPSSGTNIRETKQPVVWYFRTRYYWFFLTSEGALGANRETFVCAASITDLARIACALERFRLARGTYPEALAKLEPEFIDKIPAEIVNGEPYRYGRTEDGSFLLYSVGADLRDDGGLGIDNRKMNDLGQADWAWRYPAK